MPRLGRAADRRSSATSGASTASSPPTTSGVEMLATAHRMTARPRRGGRARARRRASTSSCRGRSRSARPSPTPSSDGRVDEALLDAAVARVLRMKFRLGLFERPYVELPRRGRRSATLVADGGAGGPGPRRALARPASRTTGVLPLAPDLRRVAVIGPIADSARDLLGDYSHMRPHGDAPRDAGRGRRVRASSATARSSSPATSWPGGGRSSTRCARASRRRRRPCPRQRDLGGTDAEIAEAVAARPRRRCRGRRARRASGLTDDSTTGEFRDRAASGSSAASRSCSRPSSRPGRRSSSSSSAGVRSRSNGPPSTAPRSSWPGSPAMPGRTRSPTSSPVT